MIILWSLCLNLLEIVGRPSHYRQRTKPTLGRKMQTNEQGLWSYHRKRSLFERIPNTNGVGAETSQEKKPSSQTPVNQHSTPVTEHWRSNTSQPILDQSGCFWLNIFSGFSQPPDDLSLHKKTFLNIHAILAWLIKTRMGKLVCLSISLKRPDHAKETCQAKPCSWWETPEREPCKGPHQRPETTLRFKLPTRRKSKAHWVFNCLTMSGCWSNTWNAVI